MQNILDSLITNIILYIVLVVLSIVVVKMIYWAFPKIVELLERITIKRAIHVVLIAVTIYIFFFSIFTIIRYNLFASAIYDLGNMEQAAWNTVHGNLLRMTTYYPAESRLFYHVEPIWLVITPFFYLWQDPRTLLIIQSILLGLGAIPVFLVAYEKLKNQAAAMLLAISYLFIPALQQANIFDFHPLVLCIPFILTAFYFVLKNQYKLAFIFFLLAAFCREEIAVTVFLFGVYIFIFRNRKWGMIIGLTGLVWAVIALKIIIPAFSPSGSLIQYTLYSDYGNSPIEIIKSLAIHPLAPFYNYGGLLRLNHALFLLVPFAFLPLFSPMLLLTGSFSYLTLFLSGKEDHLLGLTHRNASLLPSLILACIFGLSWITKKIKNDKKPKQFIFWASAILLINVLVLLYHQDTYLSFGGYTGSYGQPKIEAAREGIKLIPKEASLVTSWLLGTHLANRRDLYTIDTPYRFSADYIFINSEPDIPCVSNKNENEQIKSPAPEEYSTKNCEASPEDYQLYLEQIRNNKNYGLIFDRGGILLFKKLTH